MPENLLFSIKANTKGCLDGIKQSFAENGTIVGFWRNIKTKMMGGMGVNCVAILVGFAEECALNRLFMDIKMRLVSFTGRM